MTEVFSVIHSMCLGCKLLLTGAMTIAVVCGGYVLWDIFRGVAWVIRSIKGKEI